MIYPSTATLTGDGISTASVEPSPVGGFGDGFGEAFGSRTPTGDAAITGGGVGYTDLTPPAGSAVLSSDGVSTVVLIKAPVVAELQLV